MNIIIPLSTVGVRCPYREARRKEGVSALRGHGDGLDMAERLNYIGEPENSEVSRLLEWSDVPLHAAVLPFVC